MPRGRYKAYNIVLTLLNVIDAVLEFVVRLLSFHHFAVFLFYNSKCLSQLLYSNEFEFGASKLATVISVRHDLGDTYDAKNGLK